MKLCLLFLFIQQIVSTSTNDLPFKLTGHARTRTRQQVKQAVEELKQSRLNNRFFVPKFFDDAPWIDLLVGSPPKLFTLYTETGHTLTWLIDPKYASYDGWQQTYNSTSSQTSKTNGKTITGQSGIYQLTGQQYTDQVLYNDNQKWTQSFGVVNKVTGGDTQPPIPVDGVLGIAWDPKNLPDQPTEQSPFILNALSKYRSRVFSLWSERYVEDDIIFANSSLHLGSVDEVNCNKTDLTWFPLLNSNQNPFQFNVDKFKFKGFETRRSTTAFLDTGFPFVILPSSVFNVVFNYILPTFDDDLGAYTIECTKMFELPPLTFTIGNKDYLLESQDYVVDLLLPDEDKCFFAIEDAYNFPNSKAYTFGEVFGRRYCTAYDIDNFKAGLAAAFHKDI